MGSYANLSSQVAGKFLRSPYLPLASHWTFQSLCYMDRTERAFKIGIDILFTALGVTVQRSHASFSLSLLFAFLVAHSINFLFNGHLWGVLKHYGYVSNEPHVFEQYRRGFVGRAKRQRSIKRIEIYGGISRGEWSPRSDLDARLLRHPGWYNGLHASCFALLERTYALFSRFPLDLYVMDGEQSACRFGAEAPLQIVASGRHDG